MLTTVSPAISVLMAENHAGRFLDAALHSLANQTFKDFEIILVDNNSRDGSDRIIAEWAAKDERIRPYRMDVLTTARCLNFAASVARAPMPMTTSSADATSP
jgi:glycosyltransferase involved in cell wall biosynthesis